jgi:hypothetical protein
MKRKFVVAAAALGLVLSGCSLPPLNFTPTNVPQNAKRHNAALISTTVTTASPEEASGKLNTGGVEADVASLWKSNLEDSLLRMAVFQDNSPNRLALVVKILELDLRSLGFTTRTTARYELIDRNTGKPVYSTEVVTNEGASDYVGDIRVRKSASRSVQANIEEFLRRISEADIAVP